jgi:hemin uptake protein HemP
MSDGVPEASHDRRPLANPQPANLNQPRTLCSEKLFEGRRLVVIEHGEQRYRLLITRNDRLILQK